MALKYAAFFILLCSVQVLFAATISIFKRSIESANTTTEPQEICVRQTPCGWAVYNRFSRYIDYFMKNQCECPSDLDCLRTDDDISITAYVYRCMVDPNKNNNKKSSKS